MIQERLRAHIERQRAEVKAILGEHGDRKISEVTIAQAYGGMRGVRCMITETSSVDPIEGIRYRGYTISQLQSLLPKAEGDGEPLPEGVFHLLLTGEIPSQADVAWWSQQLRSREALPEDVRSFLEEMPRDTHPMLQLSMGILALGRDSQFARRYRAGLAREDYWPVTLDDAITLLARLPLLASFIYRRAYRGGEHIAPGDPALDWGANLAHMLGLPAGPSRELMRLYLCLHADHEGGNVSAHATHLVGSALADPYVSLSAGINGLSGPLHGLANQEAMRWILDLKSRLGDAPSPEQIERHVEATLDSGQVIPGYGHAVLRTTDPRYLALKRFAEKHLPGDSNFRVVRTLYDVVPRVLERRGKAKNPWPNVNAHSGCLLVHYGVTEFDFYTVLFGVSRALGVLASLVWDRALHLPIERPKSVTTDWIQEETRRGAPVS